MKRIFKANWLINTCDLRQQKYARIILSVIVLIILLMFEGFRLLLKKIVRYLTLKPFENCYKGERLKGR